MDLAKRRNDEKQVDNCARPHGAACLRRDGYRDRGRVARDRQRALVWRFRRHRRQWQREETPSAATATATAGRLRVIGSARSSGDFAVTAASGSKKNTHSLWVRGYGRGLS